QQERLILRLPAEPRDRPVVAVIVRLPGDPDPVWPADDPERGLDGGVRALIGDDCGVGDLLDQPGAEHRGGNAKDHVVVGELPLEVRLPDRAAAGVGVGRALVAAADHEEPMDAAVRRAVGLALEPRLPYRDRKSTRLNSSHEWISYAVFCLKKK